MHYSSSLFVVFKFFSVLVFIWFFCNHYISSNYIVLEFFSFSVIHVG